MIKIERFENNNGIYISGDYEDLYFLREAVSSLAGDKDSYDGYEEVHGVVQKFVFELLHTYRAERDSFKTNCDTPCYKFEMYFPEAIFVADALNDYIMLWESEENYTYKIEERTSSVIDKMRDRHFIDKAFIRFFQASVWNAVREAAGDERFEKIGELKDYEAICKKGDLRYRGYCKDWIDIMNIRLLNSYDKEECIAEMIGNFAVRGEEYLSKERAMKEHFKDGNISLYIDLLSELQYPSDEDEEYGSMEELLDI